jgi:hypothetical protein
MKNAWCGLLILISFSASAGTLSIVCQMDGSSSATLDLANQKFSIHEGLKADDTSMLDSSQVCGIQRNQLPKCTTVNQIKASGDYVVTCGQEASFSFHAGSSRNSAACETNGGHEPGISLSFTQCRVASEF